MTIGIWYSKLRYYKLRYCNNSISIFFSFHRTWNVLGLEVLPHPFYGNPSAPHTFNSPLLHVSVSHSSPEAYSPETLSLPNWKLYSKTFPLNLVLHCSLEQSNDVRCYKLLNWSSWGTEICHLVMKWMSKYVWWVRQWVFRISPGFIMYQF